MFSPLLFKASTYGRSEYGVFGKGGKLPYTKSLWKLKSWWKGNMKIAWFPLLPVYKLSFRIFLQLSWGEGGGCLEDHWILNYSSLGTYWLGQGTCSLLIIHFCGIPLRQIVYTYVPGASLLCIFISLSILFMLHWKSLMWLFLARLLWQ